MSNSLQKQLFLHNFKKAEAHLGLSVGEEDDDEGKDGLGDLPCISPSPKSNKSSSHAAPLPNWKEYFSFNEKVELSDQNFVLNTYYNLPSTTETSSIPIFIFHHGAGSSAMTFAPLAKELYDRLEGKCGTFSFDARGHGQSRPISNDIPINYDLDTFVQDFKLMVETFYNDHLLELPQGKLSLIFVGHSLGGSICTFLFHKLNETIRNKALGVAMFDIVEEAAILALDKVDSFLAATPNNFRSMDEAVDWHVANGLSKTRSSASVAIPALFRESSTGKVIRITNLLDFSPFWNTWFKGLSERFVSLPTSKLLILAGNDNLDKRLIIGQMQGKYQLVVFQESGHFIQEDYPAKTAVTLIDFWKRNDTKSMVIKTNWGHSDK